MTQNLLNDFESTSVILTLYTTELRKYFLNSNYRNIFSKFERKITDISHHKHHKTHTKRTKLIQNQLKDFESTSPVLTLYTTELRKYFLIFNSDLQKLNLNERSWIFLISITSRPTQNDPKSSQRLRNHISHFDSLYH